MIHIEKLGKPQVLIENETQWTATIMAKLASGRSTFSDSCIELS